MRNHNKMPRAHTFTRTTKKKCKMNDMREMKNMSFEMAFSFEHSSSHDSVWSLLLPFGKFCFFFSTNLFDYDMRQFIQCDDLRRNLFYLRFATNAQATCKILCAAVFLYLKCHVILVDFERISAAIWFAFDSLIRWNDQTALPIDSFASTNEYPYIGGNVVSF